MADRGEPGVEETHVLVIGGGVEIHARVSAGLNEASDTGFKVDHAESPKMGLQALLVGPYAAAFVVLDGDDRGATDLVRECDARGVLVPLIGLGLGFPRAERARRRQSLMALGAADLLLRDDLSPALLESAVFHAVERGRMVRQVREVEAQKELGEQAFRESRRLDTLTDLPSRALFMERLAQAVERARKDPSWGFAVLLVDVDKFGLLNEGIGRRAADTVLTLLARRLEACVGSDDIVARYGGDKFAILLVGASEDSDSTRVADGIHRAVKEPFMIDGQPVYTTVNIGMTASDRDYERAEDVINDVSAAASRAKHRGERREIFQTSMRVEALARVRLEAALRQAVGRDEFVLHYQPIVALDSGKLIGFESLIRWHHPSRGLVSPAEFIPVAESTGLIVPIGRWVMREAANQLRSWHDEFALDGGLTVTVNLSARQIADPRLLDDLEDVLSTTQLDPGTLKLELTESVVLENAALVTDFLSAAKRFGVGIYVDDFGTGYSSLSYLHRFPVDGLKIDKSFVDVVDGTQQGAAMVKGIVSLAESFGVDVIAEGIERQAQAQQLLQLGCRSGQGYLFSRPLSAGDAYAFVARAAN